MPKIRNYITRPQAEATGNEYVVVTDLVEEKTYKMKLGIEPSVSFNQALNTYNDVFFNSISGDGSGLTGLVTFDQDLNTTDDVQFTSITIGTGSDAVFTPDVAATGSSVAYTFDTKNTFGTNDKVFAFSNNTTEVFSCDHLWLTGTDRRFSSSSYTGQLSMMDAYSINAAGNLEADAYIIGTSDNKAGLFAYLHDSAGIANYDQQITFQCGKSGGMIFRMQEDTRVDQITGPLAYFQPQITDGATAVAYLFKSGDDLATAGAKIASFSNQNTEIMNVHVGGVYITGGLALGNDVENNWGSLPKTAFVMGINDTSVTGNTGMNEMLTFANIDAGYVNYNEIGVRGWINDKMDFYMYNQTTGEDSNFIVDLGGTGGLTQIRLAHAGDKMILNPTVSVTGTAYSFDTLNTLTTGKIASFSNQNTEIMNVHVGGVDLGAGLQYTIDGVPLSGGESFGFKKVDPNGNGDYLTIADAFADTEYKLFLVNGIHTISTTLFVPQGTEIILEGESKSGAIVEYSGTANGAFRINDDPGGVYDKYSATGTYTRDGKTITYTGTTPADMTTIWNVGDLVIIGNNVGGAGAGAIITAITASTVEFDNFALSSTGVGYLDMGYIWTVGQAHFTARNVTFDTGVATDGLLNKSIDSWGGFWDCTLLNVDWTGNGYPVEDYDTCWKMVVKDCNFQSHFFTCSRAYIENCMLEKTYIDAPNYGGDSTYVNCTITKSAGGDFAMVNTTFTACKFLYDLVADININSSGQTKFRDCLDINGPFYQPVDLVVGGAQKGLYLDTDASSTGSTIVHKFGTSNTMLAGDKVASFKNFNTEIMSIEPTGATINGGLNFTGNLAIGAGGNAATSTGIGSIAIGDGASTSHNYSIAIGAGATSSASMQCDIGSISNPYHLKVWGNLELGVGDAGVSNKIFVQGDSMVLDPFAANTADAYIFKTTITRSTGSIAKFYKDTTNVVFDINQDGTIISNTGATYGYQQTNGVVTMSTYLDASSSGLIGTTSNHVMGFYVNDGSDVVRLRTDERFEIDNFPLYFAGVEVHISAASPEGVVAAPTGSWCMNTAGGAGTTLYVKESSPTTTTGWVGK